MKTKYYLNQVELNENIETNEMSYDCLYSNGQKDIHVHILVNLNESINIPTIYEN